MATATQHMDEEAQVGIGTMIVFIATVLVSAIAAGVLLDMSGKLQQKSTRTGTDATQQISANLFVESVVGLRNQSTDSSLQSLEMYVTLAPGANEIDLAALRVQMANGTVLVMFDHVDGAPDSNSFNATEIRDVDNSFTSANPTMSAGDLVKLTFNLSQASLGFGVRDQVSLDLIPEQGTKVSTGFTTPSSFGTRTIINLL